MHWLTPTEQFDCRTPLCFAAHGTNVSVVSQNSDPFVYGSSPPVCWWASLAVFILIAFVFISELLKVTGDQDFIRIKQFSRCFAFLFPLHNSIGQQSVLEWAECCNSRILTV